jgi:hypothetical protein
MSCRTAPFTPGRLAVLLRHRSSLPPNTGQSLIAAHSMFGSLVSIASILPLSLLGYRPFLAGDLSAARVFQVMLLGQAGSFAAARDLAVARGARRSWVMMPSGRTAHRPGPPIGCAKQRHSGAAATNLVPRRADPRLPPVSFAHHLREFGRG